MKKKMVFEVSIPYVEERRRDTWVESRLHQQISHPEDEFFDAFIGVKHVRTEECADMPELVDGEYVEVPPEVTSEQGSQDQEG